MKTKITTAIIAIILVASTAIANSNPIKKVPVNTKKSSIAWVGKKITGKHTGTISLKEGVLEMDGDKLVGGNFIVDMTTINVTDLKAGKGKEKLEGHLNSEDFFGVENNPEASFTITKVASSGNGYSVLGNLTIKGITEQVKILLTLQDNIASTSFKIDRTKFGITYKSGSFFDNLKDKAIKDEFELTVNLVL